MGTKSSPKQARVAARRQRINKAARSQVKTNITKAEKLIFAGNLDAAREAVSAAVASLDKAAEKGILHGNNTARRKSRLVKKLNAVASPPAAEAQPEPEKTE